MKQKFLKLSMAATPGAPYTGTGLSIHGNGFVYMRVQVTLRGDPALTGEAAVSVASVSAPYTISVEADGEALDSRMVAVNANDNPYGQMGFSLLVDPSATFPSGQVDAEVIVEAPDGYSFIYTDHHTLQAD